jgi:hypothetical protein
MEQATPKNRRRNWSLFVIVTPIGVVALLVSVVFVAMQSGGEAIVHAVIVGKTGPVTNPSDWPEPLKKLRNDLGAAVLPTSKFQVHCLCHGLDHEYVWRMDVCPGLFEHVQKRWRLSPVSNPSWSVLEGKSNLSGESTPSWWSPKQGNNTKFYECPATRAGEKGDRFCVAFDESQGIIFVHYWYNF